MRDGKSCWDCLYLKTKTYEVPCCFCWSYAINEGVHPRFTPNDGLRVVTNSCDCKEVTRSEILTEVNNIVSGKRKGEEGVEYGVPEENFKVIAALWGEYLDMKVKPHDVAVMMALLKIARIKGGAFKKDNWIDLAGYAACGGECQSKE